MSNDEFERMIADWPEDDKQLARELQESDDYMEAWRLWTKGEQMPANPAAWLDGIEAQLPKALEKVSPDVADEFQQLITDLLHICRIELDGGIESDMKMHFAVLAENVELLKNNITIHHMNASQETRRQGGRSTGELKRCEALARIEKARAIWERLDKPERDKASIVSARMGIPADTVRRWKRSGWMLTRKADTS